jgi:DNA-binding TFAR19-related protein (PDSD5 family)
VAAAIDLVVGDRNLRSVLAHEARERLSCMSLERSRERFAEVIRSAIAVRSPR